MAIRARGDDWARYVTHIQRWLQALSVGIVYVRPKETFAPGFRLCKKRDFEAVINGGKARHGVALGALFVAQCLS